MLANNLPMDKKALLKAMSGGGGNGETPPVNDRLRSEWNDFIDFLDARKLKGDPRLDTGDFGNKLLDEYVATYKPKELSRARMKDIWSEVQNYRSNALAEIKSGKAQAQVPEERFMSWVVENAKTKNPEYVGRYFSTFKFPKYTAVANVMGNQSTNKGFAQPGAATQVKGILTDKK